jgi:hypothetical protein
MRPWLDRRRPTHSSSRSREAFWALLLSLFAGKKANRQAEPGMSSGHCWFSSIETLAGTMWAATVLPFCDRCQVKKFVPRCDHDREEPARRRHHKRIHSDGGGDGASRWDEVSASEDDRMDAGCGVTVTGVSGEQEWLSTRRRHFLNERKHASKR